MKERIKDRRRKEEFKEFKRRDCQNEERIKRIGEKDGRRIEERKKKNMKEQRKKRMRIEEIKKELIEMKHNKKSKISQPIIFLSLLCLSFSYNQRLKKEGSMIINNGNNKCESCV